MRVTVVDMPNASTVKRWAFLTLAVVLGIVVVGYLAYLVREIWLPLGLALILATVLDPVVDRMEMRGWKRQTGAAFIFGSFILVAGGLIWLAVPQITAQVQLMSDTLAKQFPNRSQTGIAATLHAKYRLDKSTAEVVAKGVLQGVDSIGRSAGSLTKFGLGFASNLIWIVIIPIVAFYALRDFHLILGKLLLLVPRSRRKLAQTTVSEVSAIFARYLRGLGIVSLLNGVATWLLLTVLGVQSALLIGLIAGFLYSVPYVGAFLTLAITGAFALIQGAPDPSQVSAVVDTSIFIKAMIASVMLHQLIFDNIISPRVLGGQVGIHPILSIIALLAGNLLLGIIGMILAVPFAAVIQIGVLALIPKLKLEIDEAHPAVAEVAKLAEDSKAQQIHREDATGELHGSVLEAVEEIETQAAHPTPPLPTSTPPVA